MITGLILSKLFVLTLLESVDQKRITFCPHSLDEVMRLFWKYQFTSFFQETTFVRVNHTQYQWVDLGDLSQACIAIPETCDTQGGTLSVWVRVYDCHAHSAVIGSASTKVEQTNFMIMCYQDQIRYGISFLDNQHLKMHCCGKV